MAERTTIDVSGIIEQQKLGRFLVGLVLISWIITFFDGLDTNLISFAAPYFGAQYHLTKLQLGNIFSMGLFGTMVGGFALGYLGDRIGRRPVVIVATAALRHPDHVLRAGEQLHVALLAAFHRRTAARRHAAAGLGSQH